MSPNVYQCNRNPCISSKSSNLKTCLFLSENRSFRKRHCEIETKILMRVREPLSCHNYPHDCSHRRQSGIYRVSQKTHFPICRFAKLGLDCKECNDLVLFRQSFARAKKGNLEMQKQNITQTQLKMNHDCLRDRLVNISV